MSGHALLVVKGFMNKNISDVYVACAHRALNANCGEHMVLDAAGVIIALYVAITLRMAHAAYSIASWRMGTSIPFFDHHPLCFRHLTTDRSSG